MEEGGKGRRRSYRGETGIGTGSGGCEVWGMGGGVEVGRGMNATKQKGEDGMKLDG